MQLNDYLKERSISKSDFATLCSLSPSRLSQILHWYRPATGPECVRIIDVSNKEVELKDLRPDWYGLPLPMPTTRKKQQFPS